MTNSYKIELYKDHDLIADDADLSDYSFGDLVRTVYDSQQESVTSFFRGEDFTPSVVVNIVPDVRKRLFRIESKLLSENKLGADLETVISFLDSIQTDPDSILRNRGVGNRFLVAASALKESGYSLDDAYSIKDSLRSEFEVSKMGIYNSNSGILELHYHDGERFDFDSYNLSHKSATPVLTELLQNNEIFTDSEIINSFKKAYRQSMHGDKRTSLADFRKQIKQEKQTNDPILRLNVEKPDTLLSAVPVGHLVQYFPFESKSSIPTKFYHEVLKKQY